MIRLLQHYTPNFKPLIDISKPIHEEYCRLHGYSFHLKEVPEYGVYNGLEKLSQIMEVCEDGDVALVMDADAMITNLNANVENIFKSGCSNIQLCEGHNCGVMLIKITVNSVAHIKRIIKQIKIGQFNCEQDAINDFMKYYFHDGHVIYTHKHPAFNSYLSELYPEIPQPVSEEQGQWVEGSFILHLPALPISQRIEIMKNTKITR